MDAFLFGATAAVALAYWKLNKPLSDDDDDDYEDRYIRQSANERICTVTADNVPVFEGSLRSEMRRKNLWHRATYIVVRHEADHVEQHEDVYVLVQKRSKLKDYCPCKLDPTPGGVVGYSEPYRDNAIRELQEEMGIDCTDDSRHSIQRLFTFPYEDDRVRVWGELYECVYHGPLKDIKMQKEEVDEIIRMSLQELQDRIEENPEDFMPDACHAIRLYMQLRGDLQVKRRLLKGYSNSNLDSYLLRPKIQVIFFDCDDTLYFDGWKTANKLTEKIEKWCVNHGLRPGQAYELYKQYGTALRGLLAEGYLEENEKSIDGFLEDVHDISVNKLLRRDDELREILLRMDPSIPKFIFTASVSDHANRCLKALGIDDIFVGVIDCKQCNFESKHAKHSFEVAMKIAGVEDPECCLFLDDNMTNIHAARQIGWRSVLVGRVHRDTGLRIFSEHAELEIDRIHELPSVLPELFLKKSTEHEVSL